MKKISFKNASGKKLLRKNFLGSLLLTLNIFVSFPSVSIFDFDQVNVYWGGLPSYPEISEMSSLS